MIKQLQSDYLITCWPTEIANDAPAEYAVSELLSEQSHGVLAIMTNIKLHSELGRGWYPGNHVSLCKIDHSHSTPAEIYGRG